MSKSIKVGILALLASTALMSVRADAASVTNPNAVRAAIDDLSMVDTVQACYFGGRRYCWYDVGWQGPGGIGAATLGGVASVGAAAMVGGTGLGMVAAGTGAVVATTAVEVATSSSDPVVAAT